MDPDSHEHNIGWGFRFVTAIDYGHRLFLVVPAMI